jgi:hypothetical protein
MKILRMLAVFTITASLAAVARKGPCTEQTIKDTSQKQNDSSLADALYFFSPAVTEPIIGKSELQKSREHGEAARTNQKYDPSHVERIVVAASGEMAYEYGTRHLSFDEKQSGKHQTLQMLTCGCGKLSMLGEGCRNHVLA